MPVCKGCRKEIVGPYLTVLNGEWHSDCFRCAACHRAIGNNHFFEHAGQAYHEACYHERFSPRCAGCGRPITGQYTTALGKNWHLEHFVCTRCRQPFAGAGFYEKEGKPYCQRDYEELFGMRCAAGGELIGQRRYFEHEGRTYCEDHYWEKFGKRCAIGGEILKSAYLITAWGEPFCAQHEKALPKCYSCGRPICDRMTGGGVRYGDGRTMCNLCKRTSVDELRAGQRLLDAVRANLGRLGINTGTVNIQLRLAEQGELERQSNRSYGRKPAGMAHHSTVSQDGVIIQRNVDGISILHGLPREHFESIAAHELMHVHLFVNAYPEMQPVVEEGLCELAEFLWLQRQKTKAAEVRLMSMQQNEDPVYGDGYRAARTVYDRMGLVKLLAHVKKAGKLP